jgi:hypothetical protein
LPKAGKYEYPFFDLDSTLDRLKRAHELLHTDEMTREIVGETLGMSSVGGGFAYLVSSMEKYGLVQTGGGKISITELGKLALYGDDLEKRNAKSQAVLNVELFNEIYLQYGRDVSEDQIKAFLRQKATVDIAKAQKLAQSVEKIYRGAAGYIMSQDELEHPQPTVLQDTPSPASKRFEGPKEEPKKDILRIQYNDLYMEVPKEDAETALRLVAQKLGVKIG